jgi:hypothetical protein
LLTRWGNGVPGDELVHPFRLELQPPAFAVLEVADLTAGNDLADAADGAAELLRYFFDVQHWNYLSFSFPVE